jgi:hypothetical protein
MKSVLDRALGIEDVYKEANHQLNEALSEFFSSVYYLANDHSSSTLYKTGFSELAKHRNILQIFQREKWFSAIKRRFSAVNPAAFNEIFAL